MANIEERTLTLVYGTTKNYFSGSGLYIDYQGWSQQPMAIWGTKNGTATMKDAGKAVLYPKAGIHPFKADLSMIGATSVDDAVMKIYFDDVLVFDDWWYNNSQEETKLVANITDSCILNSTINSSITVNLSASQTKLMGGFGMRNNSYFKLYFQQWDLLTETIGDGFALVLPPGRVYDGETSNYFKAELRPNSTFHGWYSDRACTLLISTDPYYDSGTATQDLTLYAYATLNNSTDFYFKSYFINNKWQNPIYFYKKTINGWEKLFNSNLLKNLGLTENISLNPTIQDLNITTLRVTYNYRPFPRPVVIIKKEKNGYLPEDIYFKDIVATSGGYSIKLCDEYCIIYSSGFRHTTSPTAELSYFTKESNNQIIKRVISFTFIQLVNSRSLYIKDTSGEMTIINLPWDTQYTVNLPSNYLGYAEYRNGEATGRILQNGLSYSDMGYGRTFYYEPILNE